MLTFDFFYTNSVYLLRLIRPTHTIKPSDNVNNKNKPSFKFDPVAPEVGIKHKHSTLTLNNF